MRCALAPAGPPSTVMSAGRWRPCGQAPRPSLEAAGGEKEEGRGVCVCACLCGRVDRE